MIKSLNYIFYKSFNLILIFSIFIISCDDQNTKNVSQEKIKIHEDSISISAESLPEFKTDPHAKEYQRNQISGVVRTIFQDKKGNYWFGTQDGLCRHNGKTLIYFDIKNNLGSGVTVYAIAQDQTGDNIWIGHSGGITKYDGKYFTNYSEKDGLINNNVWSIATDKTGNVWIGTIDGVCKFDGKNFTPFEIPAGRRDTTKGVTSEKMIHSIMEDSKGNMWFATNGGAYKYDGKTLTNLSEENGLCNNFVNTIMEDKKGNIWFTSSHNGLCRYDGTSFTNITENFDTAGKGIGNILEDKTGNIWFVVKGFGVNRFDGNTITNYHTGEGLFSHTTFQIYEDLQGRIWFVGFKGVFRFDGESIINVTRDGPW